MMMLDLRTVVRVTSVLLCAFAAGAARAERDYEFRHDNVLGTSLELCVRADSEEAARSAETRALREIDRLAAVFSGYDASSEFRLWQATTGKPTKVSRELFELFARQRPLARRERRAHSIHACRP